MSDRFEDEFRAASAMAADESIPAHERAEMLMEMAMALQQKPKSPEQLRAAAELYDRALALCPPEEVLFAARLRARKATVLQAIPDDDAGLEQALDIYEAVLPALTAAGSPQECAEIEMNRGLVLQHLAGMGRARLTDAISAYQRALRVFDRTHPAEFAILQNNLATAFLSLPLDGERAKMREALAVQSFEEGLKAVSLIDYPREYAMLQNNLGNALQYASSTHAVENNLRALAAYDEALKVRNARDTPLEYANTIANRANCLSNLPDDPEAPERGNRANLEAARNLYAEAKAIFEGHGDWEKARVAAEALAMLDRELMICDVA